MISPAAWAGIVIFGLAFSYDLFVNEIKPRLYSLPQIPLEPDLPPAAGRGEEPSHENYARVLVAGYGAGVAFMLVGALDYTNTKPPCFPYNTFLKTYGIAIAGAVSGLMWYSEGQKVVIRYHSEIRYTIGITAVLIPIYSTICGGGLPI